MSGKKSENGNIRVLRPSETRSLVELCMRTRRSAFIWGPPGIGKSDIVRQSAVDMSPVDSNGEIIPGKEVIVYDVRLLLLDPTDLRGLPYRDETDNRVYWAETAILPPSKVLIIDKATGKELKINNDETSILFLDELTAAAPSVQAAAYQLVLDRKIGEYVLPKNCMIVAAGNRQSDKGVSYKMPTPLANRFVHFEMDSDYEDWAEWAIGRKIHPQVMGYINEFKSQLHQFVPTSEDRAFPTPRSWAVTSDLLYEAERCRLDDHMLTALIGGAIGMGAAIEFVSHRDYAKDLPSVRDILSGREKKMGTRNISAQYFLASALTYELHDRYLDAEKNHTMPEFNKAADNFLTFIMDNFNEELVVLATRTALKQLKIRFQTQNIPSFTRFFQDYQELVASAFQMDD